MDLAALQSAVESLFASPAAEFGLDAAGVRAEYVLNPGGFVNHSFRVTDGRARLHLKLAGGADERAKLRRWLEVADLLEARYHAPRVLRWIEIPATPFAGLLFEHVDGQAPERLTPGLRARVVPLFAALHADRELAARIASPEAPATCADVYHGTYHERFTEDLAHVAKTPPPFVDAAALAWMGGQARRMEETVRASGAFGLPADAPTHGDPWISNLLMADGGAITLLDWDELAPGDPALDYAILLGPSAADLRPLDVAAADDLPEDAALRERLRIYARATLLDWIIDPLVDWVEAAAVPAHAAEVRAEKERIHRAATALYRARFG